MKPEETIPVMANTRPWNELVLRGVRRFKTIAFNWRYRGLILLYNTKGAPDHRLGFPFDKMMPHDEIDEQPSGVIVGAAVVVDVRERGHYFEAWFDPARLVRFDTPIPFTYTSRGRIGRAPRSLISGRDA